MAFAHGSNDVANAIGPLAAVNGVVQSGGVFAEQSGLPFWILILGGSGIVAGLAMWGYKVIATIGRNITELTPSRGFAAELAAATTVVVASGTGIPVSTTHTLVGAVLGLADGAAVSKLLKGQTDLEYQHISNVSYLRSFLFLSFLSFVGFLDPYPVAVHILTI